MSRRGLKLARPRGRPVFCRVMTASATTTLKVWDNVVPRAAPAGPIPIPPIKR